MQSSWHQRLQHAVRQSPKGTTFAAFNLNIDVVARVTPESVDRLVQSAPDLDWSRVARTDATALRSVKTREDFVSVLRHGFRTGKSILLVRDTEDLVKWWREIFRDRTESMGGQAGIIANQMAALGATSVVYSPLLSPRQASLFLPGVVWPTLDEGEVRYIDAREAGRSEDLTREPWVFEYRKGETYRFPDGEITTPRANRAIITTAVQGPERRFHADIHPGLSKLGAKLDVGFLAGYHQCGADPQDPEAVRRYIDSSCEDLRALKSNRQKLKLHIEYVPAKAREMEAELYRRLGAEIHSFGINETEIRGVLRRYGHHALAAELEKNERAYLLYRGGLTLLRELGVERVHVHNLGYYIVVLRKPYERPLEAVRSACLYASAVNACKAKNGGYVRGRDVVEAAEIPLSEVGFRQLQAFADEIRETSGSDTSSFLSEGILEFDDHYALVAPAHVVPNPIVTVGMGDTISSSAYFYEVCAN